MQIFAHRNCNTRRLLSMIGGSWPSANLEKPFGTGKDSAASLNVKLHEVCAEEQSFRIDHFLGEEPVPIGEEKNKVFRSMLPIRSCEVVRGQYAGYRAEPGVHPESDTETFVALKCAIDNWRWAGVPFYLRTGKRLANLG